MASSRERYWQAWQEYQETIEAIQESGYQLPAYVTSRREAHGNWARSLSRLAQWTPERLYNLATPAEVNDVSDVLTRTEQGEMAYNRLMSALDRFSNYPLAQEIKNNIVRGVRDDIDKFRGFSNALLDEGDDFWELVAEVEGLKYTPELKSQESDLLNRIETELYEVDAVTPYEPEDVEQPYWMG